VNRLTPAQAEQQSWFLDGYRSGHTVEQIVRRAVEQMDAADAREPERYMPAWIISPDVEDESLFSRWRRR
jgi:hypothetical protein